MEDRLGVYSKSCYEDYKSWIKIKQWLVVATGARAWCEVLLILVASIPSVTALLRFLAGKMLMQLS